MPIEVELPDGRIVEFPDGTSRDTMKAALQRYTAPKPRQGDGSMLMRQQAPQQAPEQRVRQQLQAATKPKGIPTTPEWMRRDMAQADARRARMAEPSPVTGLPQDHYLAQALGGAGDATQHALGNTVHGAAQLLSRGLEWGADTLGFDGAAQWLRETNDADQQALAQRQADYEARNADRTTAGRIGQGVGLTVGTVAPFAGGPLANRLSQAGTTVARAVPASAPVTGQAVNFGTQGALAAATQPVTEGDYWQGKGEQVQTGGLFGAAMPVAANVPGALRSGGSGLLRYVVRGGENNRQAMEQGLARFAATGEAPTLGQVGPARTRYVEAALRNVPGGAGVMRNRLEAQGEGIGRAVDNLAGTLSPATGAERGGRAVQRGITGPSGFMSRIRQKSGELYDEVERLLPPSTGVTANNTVTTLRQLTAPIPGADRTSGVLANSKVASIAQSFQDDLAANGGQISYESMKQLRSRLGELVADSALNPEISTRQLRQLYGAMSEDMRLAAMSTGNPAAMRAADRANAYHRASMQRVEDLERVIDRNGGPEAVYRTLFTNSREGGTTIRQVMRSLDDEGKKQLAAVTLRRMGRANPSAQDELGEAFSPETFLTNWNRMSPQARNAMFDGFGPTFRKDLDDIVASTALIRQSNQTLANPSGTAATQMQGAAYLGAGGALALGNPGTAASIIGTVIVSNGSARLFASPRFVNWLAQQTKLPASKLPEQMQILARLAEQDEAAAEAYQLLTEQAVNQ